MDLRINSINSKIGVFLCSLLLSMNLSAETGSKTTEASKITSEQKSKYITEPYQVPFERPIGFSFNAVGIASMTFEGRFFLGLAPHINLVLSPMYQNTVDLPFYNIKNKKIDAYFDIKRLNLGLGFRFINYEYDSFSGWYLEPMVRGGLTWVGTDKNSLWSVIPSLMGGYQKVYDSGYFVSFGGGFEWEFWPENKKKFGADATYLKSYLFGSGITKIPLTFELSMGWMW